MRQVGSRSGDGLSPSNSADYNLVLLPVLLCACVFVQEARPRWWRLELALQPSTGWVVMLLLREQGPGCGVEMVVPSPRYCTMPSCGSICLSLLLQPPCLEPCLLACRGYTGAQRSRS